MADTPDRVLTEPLSIYPNPGDGNYFIALTGEPGVIDVIVRNQLGQEVKTMTGLKAEGNRYALDVRELPQGIYTVEIRTARGKAMKKVIKYQESQR